MGGKERRLLTLVFPNAKKYGWIYELSFCARGWGGKCLFSLRSTFPLQKKIFFDASKGRADEVDATHL